MSSVLTNYRGISGVALSVPTVVDATGAARPIVVPMSEQEDSLLQTSASAIRGALQQLGL